MLVARRKPNIISLSDAWGNFRSFFYSSLPRALAAKLPSASGNLESHVPKKEDRPTLAPGSASTAARSSALASSASSPVASTAESVRGAAVSSRASSACTARAASAGEASPSPSSLPG
jgi:hypothetical protein